MTQRSPTLEGFRAILRQPSFGLAEIAWRWSFGVAAALLLTFSFLEYLDTLPVTRTELFLLRTHHPILISRAIAHILRGSAPRVVAASIVLALALAIAWAGIASLGRAATVKALLYHFRENNAAGNLSKPPLLHLWREQEENWRLRPLVGLNLFRVGITLAAAVGCLGALLLAGFASPKADPSPGSAALILLMLVTFVGLSWSVLNWFLSLAAIFVVGDGRDTFGAVAAAVDLFRARTGPVVAASTWFGLGHVVAFVGASSVVAFPLAFARMLPLGVVLGGVLLVTLLYFAVVDFLYVARLAAYMCIVEGPETPPALQTAGEPGPQDRSQHSALDIQTPTGVDPDELILSDIPVATD
jgi:hypothetical protein